ncbi:MAG: c-type cytochrome biogenesis protein CcmI [Pseudomonadota bacterium]
MMWFYLGASALLLLGLIFALWPMIRVGLLASSSADTAGDRQQTNVVLYKDHLRELETSLEQGLIKSVEFDKLKQELERNLLEDSAGNKSLVENKESRPNKVYWLATIVSIPLVAVFVYQILGNMNGWQLKQSLKQKAQLEEQLLSSVDAQQLENQLLALNRQISADLESYSEKFPDDLQARALLARNAVNNGDYARAIKAYRHIIDEQPEAVQIIAELAQVIFIQAGNRAIPEVGILAERAIAIQPGNSMALSLLGIFSFQNGRYEQAIAYWRKVLALYPPNSPNALAVQNGIAQAQSLIANSASANSDQDLHNTDDKNIATVKVAVSLADNIAVQPDYTVFIYARAWQGARLPLAITRINAGALPLTVELNDTMSMAPGMNLSSAEQVELVARVSPTGNAIPQPGDWQATLGPVSPATQASATVFPLIISQPLEP